MKVKKYSYPFPEKKFPFAITKYVGKPAIESKASYHLHPFAIEFQYIRSGGGSYFIKNKQYPLKDKSIFIIHGQDIHSYIKGNGSSVMDKTFLIFSNTLFKDIIYLQSVIKKITICRKDFPHQIYFNEKEATEMEFILDVLNREWQKKKLYHKEAIINTLLSFFILIKRVMSKNKKGACLSGESNPLIDKVLAYIDSNFKEPVSLSAISKHVYRSSYHISHLFKKFTGLGLKEYLANKRIIEAKRLLEDKNTDKIISVALESGFSDLSTFNRSFKALTGMSPSQYRKFCISFRK